MKRQLFFALMVLITYRGIGQNSLELRILDAYSSSVESKQDYLNIIIENLKTGSKKEPNSQYWLAFALYKQTMLYSYSNQEKAIEMLNEGIQLLENKENKNAEDLALLGFMTSYSIQFQYEIAAIISAKASKYYDQALKLDKNNFRVYLGLGKSDYFRPVKYGGGTKVIEYLQRALIIINKETIEESSPSWGKEEVYYYLSSFYSKSNMEQEAKIYCKIGLKKYPTNKALIKLSKKLGV